MPNLKNKGNDQYHSELQIVPFLINLGENAKNIYNYVTEE